MALVGILNLALPAQLPLLAASELTKLDNNGASPFPCHVFDRENGIHGFGKPIPRAWCVSAVYAPSSSADVAKVMSTVAARNGFAAPAAHNSEDEPLVDGSPAACADSTSTCMLGFATVGALKAWVAENPGRVGVGIVFGDTSNVRALDGSISTAQVITSSLPAAHIKYELWYNRTALAYKWYADAGDDALGAYADAKSAARSYRVKDTSLMLKAQRAVDEALLALQAERAGRDPAEARIDLTLSAFPRLEDTRGVASGFVPLAVFIATVFQFLMILTRVTSEKERHVAGAMRTTGLLDSAYWLSHWAHALLTSVLTSLVVLLLGMAFSLGLFVATNPALLLFILLLYNVSMSSVAFLIASIFSRVRTAAVVGFAVLIPCAALAVLSGVVSAACNLKRTSPLERTDLRL